MTVLRGCLCVLEPQSGTSRIEMLGTGLADLEQLQFQKSDVASARWQMFLGGPGATIPCMTQLTNPATHNHPNFDRAQAVLDAGRQGATGPPSKR